MKKVLFSVAIIAISALNANAQTEKGTWLLGGSAGFSSSKYSVEGSKAATNISIAPDAGYFIADDLAIGALVEFSDRKFDESSFRAAPFVRYYFLPLGDNAKLFGQGSFGFGSTKDKEDEDAKSVSNTNWEIKAGPAFFLNPSVALEVTVGYSSRKEKDVPSFNTFGLNVGFQIHLNKNGGSAKK